jgi:hypothetical protein
MERGKGGEVRLQSLKHKSPKVFSSIKHITSIRWLGGTEPFFSKIGLNKYLFRIRSKMTAIIKQMIKAGIRAFLYLGLIFLKISRFSEINFCFDLLEFSRMSSIN